MNQSMNAIVPMDSLPELVKVSAKLQVRKKKKSKSMIVRQDSQRIIPEASFKDFQNLCHQVSTRKKILMYKQA